MVKRHRILVVEDDPDAAEVICSILVFMGHECHVAHSAAEALERAIVFEPDLAIIDIGLPDASGYHLVRALRARAGDPIHVAAVTGWGRPEDRERALAAGFDQHLVKPAGAAALRHLVEIADREASAGS